MWVCGYSVCISQCGAALHVRINSNNLDHLRRATDKRKPEVATLVKPAVDLLHSVIKRLELKGRAFEVFDAALSRDNVTKKNVQAKPEVSAFMKHCCRSRHYSFQEKKCGEVDCSICGWILWCSKHCIFFQTPFQVMMTTTRSLWM